MYLVKTTSRFRKDLKKARKQGKNIDELENVVDLLQAGSALDERYSDHLLTGNWKDHRECHIRPDWLLIYHYDEEILWLVRTGSHSELFD